MLDLNEQRFEEIFNSYSNDVFRVAFSYLLKKEEAEDVVQEVFLIFYKKPPSDNRNLKGWLLSVACNLSLNLLRKRKIEHNAMQEFVQGNLVSKSDLADIHDLLIILPNLSQKYQKVIRLYYYGDMSIKEIALDLKINEATVKKRLERGRNKLKLLLEKEHEKL